VKRLLLATTNPGKQREFRRLLNGLPAELVTPHDLDLDLDVDEPYPTYEENARTKAEAWCQASGVLTLADDSGLEVAALDGGPGVGTARFGGPDVTDRVGYLLENIADAEGAARRARMVCVVAIGIPGPDEPRVELFRGTIDGSVARDRRGDGGFGYDPVFLLPEGVTTAELPEAEKDRISHRGRAVQAARPRLLELLGT
jgi:XTP/dITP diphosphohydrolase